MPQRVPSEVSASIKKSHSATFIVDDLSSIFGGNSLFICDFRFMANILLVSLLNVIPLMIFVRKSCSIIWRISGS